MKASDIKVGDRLVAHSRPTYSPKYRWMSGYEVEVIRTGETMQYETKGSWSSYGSLRTTDRGVMVKKLSYCGEPLTQNDAENPFVLYRPEFLSDDASRYDEFWAEQNKAKAEQESVFDEIRARKAKLIERLAKLGVKPTRGDHPRDVGLELAFDLDAVEALLDRAEDFEPA